MGIRKQELYRLIDKLHGKDRKIVYDLVKHLVERPLILADEDGEQYSVEADDSPLSEEEIKALKEADQQVKEEEVVDWEDIKHELGL